MAKTRLRRGKTRQNRRTRKQRGGFGSCFGAGCMSLPTPAKKPNSMTENPLALALGAASVKPPTILSDNLNRILDDIMRECNHNNNENINKIKDLINALNLNIKILYGYNNKMVELRRKGNNNSKRRFIEVGSLRNTMRETTKLLISRLQLEFNKCCKGSITPQKEAAAEIEAIQLKGTLDTDIVIAAIIENPVRIKWLYSLYVLKIIQGIKQDIESQPAATA